MAELDAHELDAHLKRQQKLVENLWLKAPDDAARQNVKGRMLSSSIRLFRAHFLEVNREEILDKALAGLEKQLREEELSGTDVLPLLDQMKEVGEEAENKYLDSLTDDFILKHEMFVAFQFEMKATYDKMDKELKLLEQRKRAAETESNEEGRNRASITSSSRDDDIFIPVVDPITKGPLLDPVKNKYCGHFYGNDSMLQTLRTNAKFRCPMVGCQNPQYLRPDHLRPDPEMAARIAKRLEENAAADGSEKRGQRKKK